jgi:hypothetical protein
MDELTCTIGIVNGTVHNIIIDSITKSYIIGYNVSKFSDDIITLVASWDKTKPLSILFITHKCTAITNKCIVKINTKTIVGGLIGYVPPHTALVDTVYTHRIKR